MANRSGRINSSQSLRIRSLECDASRMLAENLNLREEILRLQNQLAVSQPSCELSTVEQVKGQLQAKLEEIGCLIAGIGSTQKQETQRRIPDPLSWRPKVPNLHLSGHEPRMPSILEDKYYPRRTLEPDEVQALRLSDQSNESPDLGPPPVAHFECEDPIKFDQPSRDLEVLPSTTDEEDEGIPADLSINLETRKKRKDVPAKPEPVFELPAPEPVPDQSSAITRTSAKRKLSVRDSDDAPVTTAKDDFRFSRRSSGVADSTKSGAPSKDTAKATVAKANMEREARVEAPKERRVLGDSKFMLPASSRYEHTC